MKAGIFGAGAMGAVFAYYLEMSGTGTVLYEKNPAVLEAARNGLKVMTGDGLQSITVTAGGTPEVLKEADIIFIFVKTYSTGEAASEIAPHLSEKQTVLSLQNGIGNHEILTSIFPEDRVLYGSTSIGASKKDDGTVVPGGLGDTVFGGSNRSRGEGVLTRLRKAGLGAAWTDDPQRTVWEKAIVNAGINPLGAILSIPNGKIIENRHVRVLQEKLVREASAAAAAKGLVIRADVMVERTAGVCRKTEVNRCSMLQDVSYGRATEIDSINGQIIKTGKKFGIDTPVNETIYSLIKAMEK